MKLTKDDCLVWNDGNSGYWEINIPLHNGWIQEKVTGEQLRDEIIQALEIKERLEAMIKKLDDIRECKDPKNVDSYGCLYIMMGCSCVPLSLFKQVRDGDEK